MKLNTLLIVIVFLITSCTKYEDGPLITFRSKTKRLCKTWSYQSIIYTEQGITVTTNLPKYKMTFNKDGLYLQDDGYTGNWKFSGDVGLEINKRKQNNDTIENIVWEITRLSNKELWLRKNKEEHHFKAD
jgi:hypothetical protein